MSLAERIIGKNAKIFWIDGSGTVDLSGDRRAMDITREVKGVNMEAGNDTAEAIKPTLYHYAASLTLLAKGTAGTADMARIKEGSEGTLVWGEAGTAAGLSKGGFPAVVMSANKKIPYPDAVEISVSFEGQGDLTYDDNIAVWP